MAKFKFKSKKKGKFHFIKDDYDLSNFQIANESRIEIFSNKRIVVEGCQKILDYQESYIKLKLKKGSIIFVGSNFIVNGLDKEKIMISGIITNVEFCV